MNKAALVVGVVTIFVSAATTTSGARARMTKESPPLHTRGRLAVPAVPGAPPVIRLYNLQSGYWRANYVPDTYRLPHYDGQPAPPLVCQGHSGITLSTSGGSCPAGQQPVPDKRRIGTQPPDK